MTSSEYLGHIGSSPSNDERAGFDHTTGASRETWASCGHICCAFSGGMVSQDLTYVDRYVCVLWFGLVQAGRQVQLWDVRNPLFFPSRRSAVSATIPKLARALTEGSPRFDS